MIYEYIDFCYLIILVSFYHLPFKFGQFSGFKDCYILTVKSLRLVAYKGLGRSGRYRKLSVIGVIAIILP